MSDVVWVKGWAERGYGKRRIGRSAYGAGCWRLGVGVLEWQAMTMLHELTVDDRSSIVAFLKAEAHRFDAAANRYDDLYKNADAADRCRCKAGHSRTLAAQIERKADKDPR